MGSRLLKNARNLRVGRRNGDAAPPRGSRSSVPFQNLRGQSRLRGGQVEAAAEVNLPPPAVNIGVTYRDDRDGSIDSDQGRFASRALERNGVTLTSRGERGTSREILLFSTGAIK